MLCGNNLVYPDIKFFPPGFTEKVGGGIFFYIPHTATVAGIVNLSYYTAERYGTQEDSRFLKSVNGLTNLQITETHTIQIGSYSYLSFCGSGDLTGQKELFGFAKIYVEDYSYTEEEFLIDLSMMIGETKIISEC